MSSVIFELETLNPNQRKTFFKHKNYCSYIANSRFVIRNRNTTHGLFGIVDKFPDIQNMETVDKVSQYITNLADNKIPIYRGLISIKIEDAERLGFYEQDKWKQLLENRLPSIAEKLKIKFENLQYVGAVHWEGEHPHMQFMLWSNSKERSNYFVKYQLKDKMRKEFINDVFREDLIEIYKEKDLAKKNIKSENYILNELKKVTSDEKLLNELIEYEKDFNQTKRIRVLLKDSDVKNIVDLLIELKKDLRQTTGSIKYQYLQRYPDIIKKVDYISNVIINSSMQCQIEIEKYTKAKQELLEFQYSDKEKLEEAKKKTKEETQDEIIKLIGNQILDIERKWLKANNTYTYIKYNNESRDLLDRILIALYYQGENQKKINRNLKMRHKKQLSKQAKKELAIKNRNASSFVWEDEI